MNIPNARSSICISPVYKIAPLITDPLRHIPHRNLIQRVYNRLLQSESERIALFEFPVIVENFYQDTQGFTTFRIFEENCCYLGEEISGQFKTSIVYPAIDVTPFANKIYRKDSGRIFEFEIPIRNRGNAPFKMVAFAVGGRPPLIRFPDGREQIVYPSNDYRNRIKMEADSNGIFREYDFRLELNIFPVDGDVATETYVLPVHFRATNSRRLLGRVM